MSKLMLNILAAIFLDNFLLTTGFCLILLASLAARRFFHFAYPYFWVIASWLFLTITASVIGAIVVIDFLSHWAGTDRLTLVPCILGASPLFISAILAAFLLPKNS